MTQVFRATHASWRDRYELRYKGSGKWIYLPDDLTLECGRQVLSHVRNNWRPPKHFCHLKPGGHVAALKHHLSSHSFAVIDLENFFGHTTRSRVTRFLNKQLKVDWPTARVWTKMSVVPATLAGHSTFSLPFGFPQSPILASGCLDMSKLGKVLRLQDRIPKVKISVYMDDIILSSHSESTLEAAYSELIDAVNESRFRVNHKKTQAPRSQVQAFNIRLANNSLEIEETTFHKFQSAYYSATVASNSKAGIKGYVATINDEQADSLS